MSDPSPSPWRYVAEDHAFCDTGDFETEHTIEDAFGVAIAGGFASGRLDDEQVEANLRLMASAPEMAARIEKLDAQNKALISAMEGFIQEVTDALPTQNCECHRAPPCSDCSEYGAIRIAVADAKASLAKATGQEIQK
ncbi:MAG: hypothetical protein HQL97_01115 [Magnetococcales bacterium]|nr:hypothetical protein [Magnetococcales bacterium]